MEGPPNPIPEASPDVIHSVEACWLGQAQAGIASRHLGDVVAYCTGGDACKPAPRDISDVERENAHLRVILTMFIKTTEKLSAYGKTDITSWHLEDQYSQAMTLAKEAMIGE